MKNKKYTFRKFINDIHLWLGVGSGIILFLICFSGTILVFEDEVKTLFTEEKTITPTSNVVSIEEMIGSISVEGEVLRVAIDPSNNVPYKFSIKTNEQDRRGTLFLMNQYSGNYAKSPPYVLDGFFMPMFKMHRWLLLDILIGRPIVGIATIIFVILSISGIVLWFPNKKFRKLKWKSLKRGFKIDWKGKWKRINHDLHVTLGFYTAIFLLVMSLTGLFWSFEWYKDVGSFVLDSEVFGNRGGGPKIDSHTGDDAVSIDFSEVLKITESELPFQGTTVIQIPIDKDDIFSVRKIHTQDFYASATDQLKIDRDGSIIKKEIFSEKPFNYQIANSIRAIHVGSIFGGFSKTIYFISCLIATSLPVTGVIIWINKLNKKRKKRKSKNR